MLLKSLELHGFKTFPDKTKLTFGKGVTSVVGPNGSGKSNISDAIRWVLGEQSTKALRCSKMEDVVFNGTAKRKSQGFAEVTLGVDNSDRRLNFDNDEVYVTRRYYRSGESEYQINKTSVRLKDIHELFMDTGLGRDGYSIIGQGKIDEIVSSKAEDRREIFEEAAGISKYRYRKTEASRRLDKAEENLLRLRDIVSELESRVGPLKKESEKAKQFLVLSEEKKTLEICLWVDTLDKSDSTLKEHEEKIKIASFQEQKAEEDLFNIRKESENVYEKINSYTAKNDEIRRAIGKIENFLNEGKRKIAVLQNDIEHNIQRINAFNDEIDNADTSAKDLDEIIKNKEQNISERKTYIEEKEQEEYALKNRISQIDENLTSLSQTFDELNAKLNKLNDISSEHKLNTLTSQSSIVEIKARNIAIEKNITELKESINISNSKLQKNKALKNELDNKIEFNTNAIEGLKIKADNQSNKLKECKVLTDKLNLDVMEQNRKAKLLEDLERNLEGFQKSVKVVMREKGRNMLTGIHAPVSRIFNVESKFATAIETALGASMQNIVVDNEENAKRAISYLKRNNAGRATFLPINTIRGKYLNESNINREKGFVGVASDLCSYDEKYKNIVTSLLGRIVIAENIDVAFSIAKKYSYRFRVVTLDGQVVNSGGSLTGGSLNRNSGLLSRASDIENIKLKAAELNKQLEKQKKLLDEVKNEESKVRAEITAYNSEISIDLENRIKIEAVISNLIIKIENDNKSLSELKNQNNNLQDRLDNLESKKEQAQNENSVLLEKIEELKTDLNKTSVLKDELLEKKASKSEQLQAIKLDTATSQKEIESLYNQIMGIKDRKLDRAGRIEELRGNIRILEDKNKECKSQIDDLSTTEKELNDKISEQNDNIEKLSDDRNLLTKQSVELRKAEQDKIDEKEKIGRELTRLEEHKETLKSNLETILNKLWEEYELSIREAKEISTKIENVQISQKRLNELKNKIKKMGSVNVSAIEEYKEVGERYEFMTEQVQDVEKSKKELISLIKDLTSQMKDIFIVSFKEINQNFDDTFKELLGGGSAHLSLSNPDDILTSGIEIEVQPKGKLFSRLEALSGGEKALVAISLYFAIMKVSPAPFCILDEIEAALDDVNVDRFASYLKKMNDNTQFIAITHRRGTMEGSDTLYGVTMQDEGISKLLSLDISKAKDKIEVR